VAIVVVSGLPRSGTSMMMQMLRAGGMAILTDGVRAPDADNPRGYFEDERVKALKRDGAWLGEAEGKAVKVVHALLSDLPPDHHYRVVLMRRPMAEVLASQQAMLQRRGQAGGAAGPAALGAIFAAQLRRVEAWLAGQPNIAVLPVDYHRVIRAPEATARQVAAFVGGDLAVDAMAPAVDPSLFRQRQAWPAS
jgi:hypothetical protein